MAVRLAIAATLIVLAACDFSILTTPASAAAVRSLRPAGQDPVQAPTSHSGDPAVRRLERLAAPPKGPRKDRDLRLILGRWCDDQGERWFFQREIVVHDHHVHRASYERRKASIVVMVDGYPDTFSKFTPDGLHMTLLSSMLDPALKMRRFTRCPELLSGLGRRLRAGR